MRFKLNAILSLFFISQLAVAMIPTCEKMLTPNCVLDENIMLAPARINNSKNKTYILPATPATSQWGYFDSSKEPVLRIKSGDTVVIETLAASNNQVVPGTTLGQIIQMNNAIAGRGPHTLTGPIYVEGAEHGDVLRIHFN